jgi:hypothetical protein
MGGHKRTRPFGLHDRSLAGFRPLARIEAKDRIVRRIGVASNFGHSECRGDKQRPSGGLHNANNSDRRLSE